MDVVELAVAQPAAVNTAGAIATNKEERIFFEFIWCG